MSRIGGTPPSCEEQRSDIELVISSRARDIGAFQVRRLLPSPKRRLVGPFIFFDHFGPVALGDDEAMDILPHPHINLATVTYLFDGAVEHRDSLGSHRTIEPGAINWMTAGKGIVHSERTPAALRGSGKQLHGLQLWVALPTESEEVEPSFRHYPRADLPVCERDGIRVAVLVGSAYGCQSPVETLSPAFYVDAIVPAGSSLTVEDAYEERAAYVVEGAVACCGDVFGSGTMLVMRPGARPMIEARDSARLVLLGGAPLQGQRHIWWNFVSSSKARLERAKQDWSTGPGNSARFPLVPGDLDEFTPLPRD